MIQILAISGSLRSASTNTALLNAASALAPQNVQLIVYDGLGNLPHFNADLDSEPPPAAVAQFRSELLKSSGVIISAPEYAHGVPGVLKNALDWLVASGELYEKPVALFNATQRGTYARQSLLETLTVMTARIIPQACAIVPISGRNLDRSAIIADSKLSKALRLSLEKFVNAIISGRASREIVNLRREASSPFL
jgi:NAD(P)H-dependent FMN reductase